MKRRVISGDEQDVVSRRARQVLCWTQRPGATAEVKRRIRRRERQEGRREAQADEV